MKKLSLFKPLLTVIIVLTTFVCAQAGYFAAPGTLRVFKASNITEDGSILPKRQTSFAALYSMENETIMGKIVYPTAYAYFNDIREAKKFSVKSSESFPGFVSYNVKVGDQYIYWATRSNGKLVLKSKNERVFNLPHIIQVGTKWTVRKEKFPLLGTPPSSDIKYYVDRTNSTEPLTGTNYTFDGCVVVRAEGSAITPKTYAGKTADVQVTFEEVAVHEERLGVVYQRQQTKAFLAGSLKKVTSTSDVEGIVGNFLTPTIKKTATYLLVFYQLPPKQLARK